MTALTWKKRTIILTQRGKLDWHWEVRDSVDNEVRHGDTFTMRGALRKAKRQRRAVMVVG